MAHLSAILDASEDAVTSTTLGGTIVIWNPCAESLYGYAASEAIGRPISLLLPVDRSGEPDTLLSQIARGRRVDHFETVRIRKDGTPIDVSLSIFPVKNASGAVIGAAAITRDITEKKRLEREMHRWRDQLQAIAQGVDDAIVVRERGGGIVYANERGARLLGFPSVAELLAVPTAEVVSRYRFYTEAGDPLPLEDSPGLLALRGIAAPPTVLRYQLTRTGEERWAEVTAVPIRDATGQVQYAASILRDISEQKRIEAALKASEARFQAFMDNSPIVAFIKDEQARFVYVNPQFERAFQATAADLIGVSDTQIVPAGVAEQIHRDDAEVLATGKLKQIVEVIPDPAGTPHHWITFKFPMTLPDGQRFIAGAAIEITDRVRAEHALKESEARFQAFMQNAPIVAYMKDESGRVVFLNHAGEQLFGIPVDHALGKNDFQLQLADRAAEFRATDQEVLGSDQVRVVPETVFAPDGTARHWMTFKFPIVLPSGARFVGSASVEITERVRAEEALQQYAERLQTLSRQLIAAQEAERLRIARDLHDQVGQSLTAVKIDLQIAQHQATAGTRATRGDEAGAAGSGSATGPELRAEFAERLAKSIALVERTIQQVREFSLDLRPSILDDLGLPSALLWYVEEQARRAGFGTALAIEQLQTRLSPEQEITCFRLVQEAITNAVRHAQATRVAVELRHVGDDLVLTVRDDGIGFDPHFLGGNIGPGDNGQNDRPPGDAGMGGPGAAQPPHAGARIHTLGLAGMQERVLLVGGRLTIESAPGAGTTVRAIVPLHAFQPAEDSTGRKGRL